MSDVKNFAIGRQHLGRVSVRGGVAWVSNGLITLASIWYHPLTNLAFSWSLGGLREASVFCGASFGGVWK